MNTSRALGSAVAIVAVGVALSALLPMAKERSAKGHQSHEADPEPKELANAPTEDPPSAVGRTASLPSSAAPSSSSASDAREDERQRLIAEQVAAQFETDSPPNADSRQLESTLKSYFDPHVGKGMALEELACRERLCRAKVVFDSVADDIDVLRDIVGKFTSEPGHGGVMAPEREYLATGKVRTVVYMARTGPIDVFE